LVGVASDLVSKQVYSVSMGYYCYIVYHEVSLEVKCDISYMKISQCFEALVMNMGMKIGSIILRAFLILVSQMRENVCMPHID